MSKFKIFIVEDDLWYLQVLEYYLSKDSDYEIIRFSTARECIDNLHQMPDLITLDYGLPDANGQDVLAKIKAINQDIPVIVISAQDDIAITTAILDGGAADYFVKDENTRELLLNSINRIREHHNLKQELEQLKEELGHKYEIQKIVLGESNSIKSVFGLVEKATKTNINISLSGETGTGKRLLAKAIHFNSERAKHPFVTVDISSVPRNLIDVELFGSDTISSDGSIKTRIGKLEEANKGTILLNEIAELDINVQAKLLQAVQDKYFTRVGGTEKIQCKVRIIISSDVDLAEEVRSKRFREDLYYALLGMPILLPPLRKRGNDIIMLAKHFLQEYCTKNDIAQKKLSSNASAKLLSYSFPGNIHELKAIIKLAAVMSNEEQIEAADISFNPLNNEHNLFPEEKTLKEYTNGIILAFLKKYDGNVVKVAEKLDIGKSTIYKMIQEKEIIL